MVSERSEYSMTVHLTGFAREKTDAMTLPADWAVFAFFETDSTLSIHCFDCLFVAGVVMDPFVIRGYKSTQKIGFIAVKHRQTLD